MNTLVATDAIPATAEVVVVGGGVVGTSTAFQLSRQGAKPVVLERSHPGAGATGKSGALVRAHYANTPETRLALESLKIFRDWDERVGSGCPGFQSTGFVRVVAPEDEDKLRRNVRVQQVLGGDTVVVSAADLHDIEPLMRTDDLTVAAFEPSSGYADPNATLYGFAEATRKRGGQIYTNVEVKRVVLSGRRVAGVETTAGFISAQIVVIAAGAYANRLLKQLGIDLGLFPRRSRVVVFRWPESVDPARKHRVVIDSTHQSWFRPEGDQGTLVGVTYGNRDGVDPDDFEETIEQDYIDFARNALAARFPAFAQATMRGGWSGVFMQSPDDHPIIDMVPSIDGLFVMTGDSGTSFKTSPAIGICLAEWIVEGAPRLVDLTPFRATRFAEGRPWIDEFAYSEGFDVSVAR